MKLRYVFPLVLAAALAGGAVTYVASKLNRDFDAYVERSIQLQKKADTLKAGEHSAAFDPHYRNLAEAIAARCGLNYDVFHAGVSEVFTDFTRSVERDWIVETQKLRDNMEVARKGPLLRIKTKAKNVELLDVGYLCHDVDVQIHRYKGKLAKIGWHVIEVVPYEGHYDSIVVSPDTGEQIRTYERLIESPGGKRLAAYAMDEGEGASGLQIFNVEGAKLVSELNSGAHLREWRPSEFGGNIREVVGWVDEETLLVDFTDDRQETLVLRDGKWQLAAPN